MNKITRVGADLAKHVIQVHAVDAAGQRITSRALVPGKFMAWCAQLPPGCLVAMEASSSAHHWARRLIALGLRTHHRRPSGGTLPAARQKRQERRQRCRCYLRSGQPPADALRSRQKR